MVGGEVPASYNFRRNSHTLALFAEGLLKAGVLKEEYWTGDLASTIRLGLGQWLNVTMGLIDLKVLSHLEFAYFDDLEDEDILDAYESNLWVSTGNLYQVFKIPYNYNYRAEIRMGLGGFGFYSDSWEGIEIGEGVQRLETLHAGAGYSVLAVVDVAMQATIDGATPQWGKRVMEWCGEWKDANESPRPRGTTRGHIVEPDDTGDSEQTLTKALYLQTVPEAAVNAHYRRAPLLRMIANETLSRPEREVAEEALALGDLLRGLDRQKRCLNHRFYCCDSLIPVCIQWTEKDELRRVFDDYHNDLSEREYTHLAYLSAFSLWKKGRGIGTMPWAIRNLAYTAEILRRVDRLLVYLQTPYLAKTFAQEARQEENTQNLHAGAVRYLQTMRDERLIDEKLREAEDEEED